MKDLLRASNVSLSFDGIKAVRDVSFSIKDKEFLGLMGPNGAGKTSLLNCLARIYDPTSGHIHFEDTDLLSLSTDQIVKLGITRTFQDLNFFNTIPDMLVIDYVRLGQFGKTKNSLFSDGLGLRASRSKEWASKKSARRILEFFRELRESLEPPQIDRGFPILYGKQGFADLIDVEYQPIESLSFAWRRRLDLARALVSKPRLILLDEPAQGLPPSEIENLGEIFKKIRSEFGMSGLIVEHNMSLLLEISDRVMVMNSGEKLMEGTPLEVKNNKEVIEVYLGKEKTLEEKPENKLSVQRTGDAKTEEVLKVSNLDVFYGRAQALFSVSVELFTHQIASVLGTNGSGKSTLLKAISGAEKPSFGEILVMGKYVPLGWPELSAEAGLQYVPQGHVIFPDMTVLNNLKVASYLPSKKKNYNFKLNLERVIRFFPQLRDLLKVEATKLSGGQQQMLAIAQALIAEPQILLLDEPSLGLAPVYVDILFDTIQLISKEEGLSILLVEQNVAKALEISDYIYILNAGILSGEGTSKKFKEDPSLIFKRLGFY